MYIHEHANWPGLRWNEAKLAAPLAEVRYLQGSLIGRMQSLGFPLREEAALQTLTQDVVKTSEIEGEKLNELEFDMFMLLLTVAGKRLAAISLAASLGLKVRPSSATFFSRTSPPSA